MSKLRLAAKERIEEELDKPLYLAEIASRFLRDNSNSGRLQPSWRKGI